MKRCLHKKEIRMADNSYTTVSALYSAVVAGLESLGYTAIADKLTGLSTLISPFGSIAVDGDALISFVVNYLDLDIS